MKKITLLILFITLFSNAQNNLNWTNLYQHSDKVFPSPVLIQNRPQAVLQALDSINVYIVYSNELAQQYVYDYDSFGNLTVDKTVYYDQGQISDGDWYNMQYNGNSITFKDYSAYDNGWNPVWRQWYYYTNNVLDSVYRESNDNGQWNADELFYYSYNSQGKLIQILKKNYENGSWNIDSKDSITYNATGLIHEIIHFVYSAGSWLPTDKETRLYNGQDQIIESDYSVWDGNASWNYDKRELYTYQGNLLTEILYQDYENNQWENTNKDAYQYDSSTNDLVTAIFYQYDNGNWNPLGKFTFNHDTAVTYDQLLLPTQNNNLQAELNIDDRAMFNHKLTDMTLYQYNSGIWIRVAVLNFYYNDRNVVSVDKMPANKIRIFPNPASAYFNMTIQGNIPVQSMTIYDLTGNEIKNWNSPDDTKTFYIGDLVNGLYLLKIQTSQGQALYKLVKQ